MDDIVKQAMAKWPNVPACSGWLGLDARGQWYLRDAAAQALGFGAQWLTGWMAYDDAVAATLGLSADERIAGFIHIGTPKMEAPERERPDQALLLTDWTPGA